ncbi:MAG: MerR family transcriptional regulator [Pseudodesulfovibrio sp.]
MNLHQKYISLREVGRRLDIPPSTVVYYKDKFSKYIPYTGEGDGRRRRYPAEVLEIFRRIREMFNDNWSVDQIERELEMKFSGLLNDQQCDHENGQSFSGGPDVFARELGGVLARMSDVLQNQTLFRSEIRSLRDEVAELRRERRDLEKRHAERVNSLEREVSELRRKLASKPGGRIDFPPSAYLQRPLVIAAEGEYLGVLGKGRKHFSLQDFVQLIERKVSESMAVETSWKRQDGHWVLVIKIEDGLKGREQNIVLVTRKTTTPSRNEVTEIARLNIDGNDAPDALLLTLFRQLKSVFNG